MGAPPILPCFREKKNNSEGFSMHRRGQQSSSCFPNHASSREKLSCSCRISTLYTEQLCYHVQQFDAPFPIDECVTAPSAVSRREITNSLTKIILGGLTKSIFRLTTSACTTTLPERQITSVCSQLHSCGAGSALGTDAAVRKRHYRQGHVTLYLSSKAVAVLCC